MELDNTSGFDFNLPKGNSSIIKVIGVGGAGNNALKHMYEKKIHGVDFVICNTDAQALENNPVDNKVQLGPSITEGLGAGAEPEVGEKAAIESMDDIKAILGQNTKMVFITAGMGGGTGTGAAPVIAKTAKDMGILTVGIVTVPFAFEGKRRLEQAEAGLEKLRESVDSLIVINNNNLRHIFGNLGFKQAFSKADEVLTNAAKGMAEVITAPFAINIDFRDAKTVLQDSGTALMSTGVAAGDNRAEEAVRKALDSPLLNDNKITGAKDVLLLILSGGEETQEATMDEIGLIIDYVQNEAGGDNSANIIFGVGTEEDLGDAIKVLVIATGFAPEKQKKTIITEAVQKPDKVTISLDGQVTNGLIVPKVSTSTEISVDPAIFTRLTDVQRVEMERGKQVFRLDGSDEAKSNFLTNSLSEMKMNESEVQSLEEEPPFGFTERREEQRVGFSFIREEKPAKDEKQGYDLFTYNDLEPISYVFDIEEGNELKQKVSFQIREEEGSQVFNPVMEQKEEPKSSFIDELPTFGVSERSIQKSLEEEMPTFQVQEPVVEAKEEIPICTAGRKIIAEKKPVKENSKILERRNKLREFNSRYQTNNEENFFEMIPAFRRRNIALDFENISEHNIISSYSEENGSVKERE